ncbi:MAG: hypothetical protein LBT11_01930 [Treponema sp.]|nr:hypothetical protein [Treponema sp.]
MSKARESISPESGIRAYAQGSGPFQGVFLGPDAGEFPDADAGDLCSRLDVAAASFGRALLAGAGVLLLFPAGLDRELIAHRLEGSYPGWRVLISFEAKTTEGALSQLKPCL